MAQRTSDIKNSRDYPLVSRFEGSVIEYYKATKWDSYKLPVFKDNTTKPNYKEPLKLEGKVMRWQYSTSPDNNPAYIARNFEKAFTQAGYKILLNATPGEDFEEGAAGFSGDFYGGFKDLNLEKFGFAYEPIGNHKAVIIAKTNANGNDIYIVEVISDFSNVTLITQDVIEVEEADTGHVSATALSEALNNQGHMALNGLYFNNGQATLQPASEATLQALAAYLKANPTNTYFLVGHTDNTGDFEANQALSKNRALNVLQTLTEQYGVVANQLKAYGVGSLAPVKPNTTESGRAKNRRVELVRE